MLARHGYGVLLLVPRGQGASEGDIVRWAGDTDLLAGADYLRNRPDVDEDRIGAIGFSIGGEQLLEAARSTTIRAVVSEGAGGRVGETDASGLFRPLVDASMLVMTTAATVFQNHGPPRIEERIGLIAPRSVFLIYAVPGIGEEDIRQPTFYAAAGEPKAMWRVRVRAHRRHRGPARRVRAAGHRVRGPSVAGSQVTFEKEEIGVSTSTHDTIRLESGTGSRVLTEAVAARAALGVVALHVADDNFLQPQPGTSASDHLVSGLVPLAVLVLVAWAYPRLRAGLRATLALFLGGFGVVTGVEAVYYTAKGTVSGDDFTGFLAIAAGVLLVAIGVVTLWRTRRRDDSRPRRYLRRLLLAVGAVAALYVLVIPFYVSYVFTHVARGFVPPPEPGRSARGGVVHDERRPQPGGLVRALEEPRGDHRLCRAAGYTAADADARPPRVRRPPLRPPRRGRERGRPEHLRLARGAGRARRRRLPQEPGRRRPGSDRGHRALGGRRDDDRGGRRVGRSRRDRLGGGGVRSIREALAMDGSTTTKWLGGVLVHAVVTPGVALFSNDLPPPSLEDLAPRIAPRPVFFVYATPGQGGESELNDVFHGAARSPRTSGTCRAPGIRVASRRSRRSTSGASSGSSTAHCSASAESRVGPTRRAVRDRAQHALVDVADEGAVAGRRLALHLGPLLVGSEPFPPWPSPRHPATRAGRRTRSGDRCSSPRPRGCGIRGAP